VDRDRLRELIEASDLDNLVRFIDGVVEARDWAGLVGVRDACREAVERGKQLWGVAEFAEYRIALDAPGPIAAEVVAPGAGRFGNGPLWEVAASTHPWAELTGVIDPAMRALIAHERLLRNDDVSAVAVDRLVVDAPLVLEPWEPDYPVAVYRSDRADFPEAGLADLEWVDVAGEAGVGLPQDAAADALLELVRPWLEESSGRGEAVVVEGTAEAAVRSLGPRRVRSRHVSLGDAMAAMAWAGASGGAYGRRRGAAVGRSLAWWTLACLLGLEDDWPVAGAELGAGGSELRWLRWDPGDAVGGWGFHLAVEDPVDGIAWAVSAVDAR